MSKRFLGAYWALVAVLLVGFFLSSFGVATTRVEVVNVVDHNDCVKVVGTREYNTKFLGLIPSGQETYKVLSDGREITERSLWHQYVYDHSEVYRGGYAQVVCKESYQEKK